MNESFLAQDLEPKNIETPLPLEALSHLDVTEVMKEHDAYFVHTIQVTDQIDVSTNNKAVDTKSLDVSDKLDILYAANPSISTSTLRPDTLDGTFKGGLGVVLSAGEIATAHNGDVGSIAVSLTERVVQGENKTTPEDVESAINRNNLINKSYNEIIINRAEVAGGFIKLDKSHDVLYEDFEMDYGPAGGGVVSQRVGKLNLANVYNKDRYGNPNPKDAKRRHDVPFNVLREMDLRGPVFVMSDSNELFLVQEIDTNSRVVTFAAAPFTPKDVAEIFGNNHLTNEGRQSAIDRLIAKGRVIKN